MPPSASHPARDIDARLEAGIRSFRDRFGADPNNAASAPGRVNLIGEHTDYNQGFVLPVAINRRTWLLATPVNDSVSSIHSDRLDRTTRVDLTAPLTPITRESDGFFANYVIGVAHGFARLGHRLPNLDLLIVSDVPIGSGLSSSAALEVASATLFESILGLALEPMEKVRLCQRAEHAFPGTPCGIMDMYIATMAREDHALLIDCRTCESHSLPMPADTTLLLVDSGVRHELAESQYAQRRATCEAVADCIGVPALRDATLAMLDDSPLTECQRKRASHVITENTRTLLAAEALRQGDCRTFGDLMFQSHDSLRDAYEVSCPALDEIVDRARAMTGNGVYGARMTGGGFGGCAIVLCAPDAVDQVRADLRCGLEIVCEHDAKNFTTKASNAARCESCLP